MIQPGSRLGHYEIVSALGRGGMGEVWRARDTTLGREVAIKTLPAEFADDPDRLARFEREARLLAQLNHPNIAAIYGLEEHQGSRFLVLELVEGDSLADRLKGEPVPEDEALKIALQMAEAIEAAHEKGVIHRDLKPANVKITPEGKVKVLDFGLAKSFVGDDIDVNLSNSPTMSAQATQQGVILGTAAYMSPEQVRGRLLDKRTDVWSFGVVLYEMLTGRRLFPGDTVSDIVANVLKTEPNWNTVPARFRKLLRRCLEREPDKRLRHVGDIELLLEETANETSAEARVAGAKNAWIWAAGAVSSVILLAIALAVFPGNDSGTSAEVFRSQIPQPDDMSFTDIFSVSPDGSMLAFIATTEEGAQIWIRDFASLSNRPLAETLSRNLVELTGTLMWSPDSRSLAYWRDDELRTIDVSGESPSTLITKVPGVTSGFWGADDRIIFEYPGSGGLQQVASHGGELRQTTIGNHFYPSALPDGRFLYTEGRDDAYNILTGSADRDPEEQDSDPVITGALAAVYMDDPRTGTGHLLTLNGSLLSVRRFDPLRLESLEESRPLAANISERTMTATSSIFRPLAVSASANRLIYRTGDLERMRLTWFDREGNELGTVGEAGTYDRMDISPDGSQLAVTRVAPGGGNFDLWIYGLTGADQGSRFTAWEGGDYHPVWSWPDGGRIAFTSTRDQYPQDVYVKDSRGTGDATLVYGTPLSDFPTSWSPDGRFLLVWQSSPGNPSDIVLLPLSEEEDGEPRPLIATRFQDAVPKFSPDQRFLSFASDRSEGEMQVFVQAFDPDPEVQRRAVPVGLGFETQWRADSKEFYYLDRDRTLTAVEVTADADGDPVLGERRALFDVNIDGFWWEAAPEGDRFLIPVPTSAVLRDAFNVVTGWTVELDE